MPLYAAHATYLHTIHAMFPSMKQATGIHQHALSSRAAAFQVGTGRLENFTDGFLTGCCGGKLVVETLRAQYSGALRVGSCAEAQGQDNATELIQSDHIQFRNF